MSNQTRTYTKKERNMYLTGMLGQNLIYNIVATGLYFYFQNVICLPAMALGWIFALARVWDAINDPMMGTIVDRTRTKWGKCRPYLIIFPAIIGHCHFKHPKGADRDLGCRGLHCLGYVLHRV